ncbi:hypothetical protein [Thermogemmatispora tikiterensis]|uniref:Uncharacterized protein n=1 Tax=Thermogemmatispora tikiterensis TaxID=1825093 RepID=A0A328VQQ5_9CHLR|nr:hypothetical protein [Thermogemmatispora tikiterensis]RAQ96475.1 hypothetical protein A4R35_13085 [Thermogemmatispora tikiterensis]
MTQVPSDHEAEPQEALVDLTKKLRKRERRLLQRLQKAQTARAKAVERLNRAQARLEKRTARLQRLEERLSLVRQQLQTLEALTEGAPASAPQPQFETTSRLPETAPSAGEDDRDREQTAVSSGEVSPMPPSAEREAAAPGISAEIGETASGNPALKELQALTHLLLEEGRREEQLRASWGRPGLSSPSPADTAEGVPESSIDQTPAAFEPANTAWHASDQDQEVAPGGQRPPDPDWVSQLAADRNSAVSTQEESLNEPPAYAAEEVTSSAPAAPQQTSQPASPAPPSAERLRQAALYGFDEPPELPETESDDEEADFSRVTPAVLASSLLPASPAELVREARAAAEAAEEAARLAIERATLAVARLELLPSGRHLAQELAEVEQAVAQASHAAEVAQTTAREVEHWAQAIAPAVDDLNVPAPAQNTAVSQPVEPDKQKEQNNQDYYSETEKTIRTVEVELAGTSMAVQPGSELPALSQEKEPAEAISLPEEEQADLEPAASQGEEQLEPAETGSAAQAAPPAALPQEQAAEAMEAGEATLSTQEREEPVSAEEEASPEAETATSPEVTAPSEIATAIPEPEPLSVPVEAQESTAAETAQTNALPESEAHEDHEGAAETVMTTTHHEKGEQEESLIAETPLPTAGQEETRHEMLSAEPAQTASEAEQSESS